MKSPCHVEAAIFCNTAIGFDISLNDVDGFKKYMDTIIANKKIDIRVTFDGITKEFTIDEFMSRLGWKVEE